MNLSKHYSAHDRLASIIILVGLFLLLFHLFDNPSLWGDEISLALSIIKYDLWRLVSNPNLDNLQSAPVGFLALAKIFGSLGQYTDWGLRISTVLATLGSFVFFYKILKITFLESVVRLVLLALFVFSPTVLFHGVELKQYAFELLANTALLYFVLKYDATNLPKNTDYVYLAAAGMLGVWFSNTIYFSLAGCGFWLFLKHWRQHHSFNLALIVVLSTWVMFIFITYWLYVHPNQNVTGFIDFWKDEFPPLITNLAAVKWHFLRIFFLMDNAFGLSAPFNLWLNLPAKWSFVVCFNYVAFGLILAGIAYLLRNARFKLAILASPLLIAYILGVAQKYPFYERFLLFYTPFLYLFIGFGLQWAHRQWKRFFWLAAVWLLAYPVATTFWAVAKPATFALYEGYNYVTYREALDYAQKHHNDRTNVYIVKSLGYSYDFYKQTRQYRFVPIVDTRSEKSTDEKGYLTEMEQDIKQALSQQKGCLFVLMSANKARYFDPTTNAPTVLSYTEEAAFVQTFDRIGQWRKVYEGIGVGVYLVEK
jgi:hypothetical protein